MIDYPFVTENSIIPSTALYLNELNLSPITHQVVSEEIVMSRLVKSVCGPITKRDFYSFYPHNNISGSIFDLLVGWYVGIIFFIQKSPPVIIFHH